jgi:predicted TIM-barrel fold metal-dependent hydrolase
MFGSDQMVWPELIEKSIEILKGAPFLTEDQKQDILYNNAARFLRLSQEEIGAHHGR